jgi:hypothetical protein
MIAGELGEAPPAAAADTVQLDDGSKLASPSTDAEGDPA